MPRPKWSLASVTMGLKSTSGRVESPFMPCSAAFYLSRTQIRLFYIKRSWRATSNFLTFLPTAPSSFSRSFSAQIQVKDWCSRRSRCILGLLSSIRRRSSTLNVLVTIVDFCSARRSKSTKTSTLSFTAIRKVIRPWSGAEALGALAVITVASSKVQQLFNF